MNFDKFNALVDKRLNYGEMLDADVVSEYKNQGCGDNYRLYLKIDDDGIIADAKFNTTGCSFSLVSLGVMCKLVINKHIDQIGNIPQNDVEIFIDGYPERRKNYIHTAMEAMQKAVQDYKNGTGLDIKSVASNYYVQELLKKQGHLKNASLSRAILEDIDLSSIDCSGINLQTSFLKNVNLSKSNLDDGNLKGAYVVNTDLSDASIKNADLRFAKMSGSILEGANFEGSLYDIGTRVDTKYQNIFKVMTKKGKEIYINR